VHRCGMVFIPRATLQSIHTVVFLGKKPSEPDRAAVLEEFQWARSLCTALHGGAATFKDWFECMTSTKNTQQPATSGCISATAGKVLPKAHTDQFPPLWTRLDGEFHSMQRKCCAPGEFIGGRLQNRSENGEWYDGANSSHTRGPRRVLATYQSTEAECCGLTFDGFAGLLVKLPEIPGAWYGSKDACEVCPLQVHDERGKQRCVELDGKQVRCIIFLLTTPRLRLLACIAESFVGNKQGVLLQGLFGAGKSAMLRALVSILAVGGKTDVMYEVCSKNLLSLQMKKLFMAVLHGSGSLATQLLSGEHSADLRGGKHSKVA